MRHAKDLQEWRRALADELIQCAVLIRGEAEDLMVYARGMPRLPNAVPFWEHPASLKRVFSAGLAHLGLKRLFHIAIRQGVGKHLARNQKFGRHEGSGP